MFSKVNTYVYIIVVYGIPVKPANYNLESNQGPLMTETYF